MQSNSLKESAFFAKIRHYCRSNRIFYRRDENAVGAGTPDLLIYKNGLIQCELKCALLSGSVAIRPAQVAYASNYYAMTGDYVRFVIQLDKENAVIFPWLFKSADDCPYVKFNNKYFMIDPLTLTDIRLYAKGVIQEFKVTNMKEFMEQL